MESIINQLATSGIPGLIIATFIVWVWKLMAQIERVQQDRIDDAKAFTERALQLQESIHRSIERLSTLGDIVIKHSQTRTEDSEK